jgi:hypothetical protein
VPVPNDGVSRCGRGPYKAFDALAAQNQAYTRLGDRAGSRGANGLVIATGARLTDEVRPPTYVSAGARRSSACNVRPLRHCGHDSLAVTSDGRHVAESPAMADAPLFIWMSNDEIAAFEAATGLRVAEEPRWSDDDYDRAIAYLRARASWRMMPISPFHLARTPRKVREAHRPPALPCVLCQQPTCYPAGFSSHSES